MLRCLSIRRASCIQYATSDGSVLTLLLSGFIADRLDDVVARFQARVVVEKVGDERQVQLLVAIDDVRWRHERATAESVGLLQHQLRTRRQVPLLYRPPGTGVGV